MRKGIVLLMMLLLLTTSVGAMDSHQSLDAYMRTFMEENGLHKGNFAVSYYNTVTGEAYDFNETSFMVAASTFKVPLNMYYYEMERDGEIRSDTVIPGVGAALETAHEQSLVYSNNDMSIGMLYYLGSFSQYKTRMRKYFTMTDEEIDQVYYADNYYCTRMMMDALKHLYENSGDFEQMLTHMKRAQPDSYFRAGVTEYEVAHKYGWFEGAVNDVGIIYTEEPFLLAVYTQNPPYEGIVAQTARALTDYNVAHTAADRQEAEKWTGPDNSVELTVTMIPVPSQEQEVREAAEIPEAAIGKPDARTDSAEEAAPADFAWWMIPVALGVFALGGGVIKLVMRADRLEKKYKRTRGSDADGGFLEEVDSSREAEPEGK